MHKFHHLIHVEAGKEIPKKSAKQLQEFEKPCGSQEESKKIFGDQLKQWISDATDECF